MLEIMLFLDVSDPRARAHVERRATEIWEEYAWIGRVLTSDGPRAVLSLSLSSLADVALAMRCAENWGYACGQRSCTVRLPAAGWQETISCDP